jgi:hypothetical protein
MFDRHTLCHAALTAVYTATGIILVSEGAFAHATCEFAAAIIYCVLIRRPASHRQPDPNGMTADVPPHQG